MIKKRPLFSVIIPVKKTTYYLTKETIPSLQQQTLKDFEVIVVADRERKKTGLNVEIVPSYPRLSPAEKRNIGAIKARGCYLAFLDDDSYPNADWLKQTKKVFWANKSLAAVCGPTLTPESDNDRQKASGYVLSSVMGGGRESFRCLFGRPRFVDDYPSVNLIVRKKDFLAINGFNGHYWPGEDTLLCRDLVYILKKKILYHPGVVVYHHRRPVFKPHLRQISRYAFQRGFFAKKYPANSFRFGYFLPSFFIIWTLQFLLTCFSFNFWLSPFIKYMFIFNAFILFLYLFFLFLTGWGVLQKESVKVALLVMATIFLTHLFYGVNFFRGLFSQKGLEIKAV